MVGSAKLRKREHEKKKREQTGERKGGEDLSLSLPFSRHRSISFPRSRAHIFACLSLSRHPHYLRAWIEILQFALSDSILKHELSNEYKALNCPRSKKTVCTQGPHAHFCARVQGLDFSFGHRPALRLNSIAWYLKKGCVQQVAYSSNMPGHNYSVNAA